MRIAKEGRVLVLDETDKAPVEMVGCLKGLIEDRESVLLKGRTMRYQNEGGGGEDHNNDGRTVWIHLYFWIWALANPATYPFHASCVIPSNPLVLTANGIS